MNSEQNCNEDSYLPNFCDAAVAGPRAGSIHIYDQQRRLAQHQQLQRIIPRGEFQKILFARV